MTHAIYITNFSSEYSFMKATRGSRHHLTKLQEGWSNRIDLFNINFEVNSSHQDSQKKFAFQQGYNSASPEEISTIKSNIGTQNNFE